MNKRFKETLTRTFRTPRKVLSLLLPLALFAVGWWFGLPAQTTAKKETAQASEEIWTCSMHPQIRQPNPGLCPICEMDLIPLQESAEGGIRELTIGPETSALLNLRVSPVVRAPAHAEISLFGQISYDERRISSLTARMGGRIDRLFVDFTGALVREGDHLAELYSPEIYVAQRELIEAKKAMARLPSDSSPSVRESRTRILQAARAKLRLLQLSDEQIDEIAAQEEPSDHITIRAPQDGVVVEKSVNLGSYVKTGDPLFKVADLSKVWLNLEAYESDLPWLRYAQDVTFTVEARPGERFHGPIAFIDPQVDPVTRVAEVRVNVDNPGRKFKPGMFARAQVESRMTRQGKVINPALKDKWISPMHPEIIKDEPGTCDLCGMQLVPAAELDFLAETPENEDLPLLVPASAVLRTGERAVVYVQIPEKSAPTFEGREIVLGARVGEQFMVANGLSEGDLVVSRGAFKLDSELQIKAKPSMMNPNSGLTELPAHQAADPLAGQWQPVLRALARLQQAGDPTSAGEALGRMEAALASVHSASFQPDTEKLWKEFSNRLRNDLVIAERQLPDHPERSARVMTRSVAEAARFLGLPDQTQPPTEGDPALARELAHTIDAYLPLAQALADDAPLEAQAAARELAEASGQISRREDAQFLRENAQELAGQSDLKAQRKVFQLISNRLISLVRSHALDQVGSAYLIHCPMAFGNTGADWISKKPEVLNPYFGDSMLRCGSVTATLSLPFTSPQKSTGGTKSK